MNKLVEKNEGELRSKLRMEFIELCVEMEDAVINVMEQGAKKHGLGSWKLKDNPSLQHKSNHDSMFHHLAESFCGVTEDKDSGEHPLAHVFCRVLMSRWRDEHVTK